MIEVTLVSFHYMFWSGRLEESTAVVQFHLQSMAWSSRKEVAEMGRPCLFHKFGLLLNRTFLVYCVDILVFEVFVFPPFWANSVY
eukprot:Gb_22562 [translate_table: standard]